jgi:hypothetical protein
MDTTTAPTTNLTFSTLHQYTHPDYKFVGPQLPVADYRIAAGLLFCQWNDHTTRVLKTTLVSKITRTDEWPYIEIGWHRDFMLSRYERIPVTKEVVLKLDEEDLLEGKKEWGYTDDTILSLNSRGKRRVFEEWFTGDNPMNLFAAGASLNTNDGKVSWPR